MRARFTIPAAVLGALFVTALVLASVHPSRANGSLNGVAGSMPAYYDHELFTINFMRLTRAQATLLAKNSQTNTIYQSDPGLPGGAPFVSVLDAIQADGFNPLWAEIQIAFTAGNTPRQLFSDNEIAAAAANGEITLTPTNELYRCSVIGAQPRGTIQRSQLIGPTPLVRPAGGASATVTASGSWGALKRAYR